MIILAIDPTYHGPPYVPPQGSTLLISGVGGVILTPLSKTITGNWILPNGSAVANGTLTLSLSQDALVSGTAQVAPTNVSFGLTSGGSIASATTIYANDELTPSGTTYRVVVSESGGGRVYGPEIFSIVGASPINLNLLTPSSSGAVTLSNPIISSPSAAQTITGFALTLTSSAPLVANGGETITNGLTVDSITAVTTAGTVSAAGNLTAANINTAGTLSATGNITTAATVNSAALSTSGNLTVVTVNATSVTASGNMTTAGTVSATGTGTFGNINTAGTLSATGNILSAATVNGSKLVVGGGATFTSSGSNGQSLGSVAMVNSAGTQFGTAVANTTVIASVPVTQTILWLLNAVLTTPGVGCSGLNNTVTITGTVTGVGSVVFNPGSAFTVTGNGAFGNGQNFNGLNQLDVVAGSSIIYSTTSTLSSTGCSTIPQYTIFSKVFY